MGDHMNQAPQGTTAKGNSKIFREVDRIQRQIGDVITSIISFPIRRQSLKPLRQCVRYYEVIPAKELPARVAQAFASKRFETPHVSIIIPVFNKFIFTSRCLLSLADLVTDTPFEIIVVDDGSTDQTEQTLSGLPGVRYHKNTANLGFVDSCNTGARMATGKYLIFLNNDTLVLPGWIEALEYTFTARKDCGLVGSMLIYPDMSLQEAGGIVFSDGSASNRGKGKDIGDPEFNYLRPTDYCSGASIMIPTELFNRIGGFDTRYCPAYYEDTDLAFSVRQNGLQVYYQPASKVIHFEGITAGKKTTQGVKTHQITNRFHFLEKWKACLSMQPERHGSHSIQTLECVPGSILVLDNQTPKPDRDSGSLDMFNALRIMVNLGFRVDYIPLYRPKYVSNYTQMLQQEGIRCFYRPYFKSLTYHLKKNKNYEFVFISRIKTIQKSFDAIREIVPQAKIIFNTVDLNFLRVGRRASVEKSKRLSRKAEKFRMSELYYLNHADASVLISPAELDLITKEIDPSRVEIIPLIREIPLVHSVFQNSKNIAFIGHFTHRPNIDAMRFFLTEIWPSLKIRMPDVRFDIIGQGFPLDLVSLTDDTVKIHGLIPDLDCIFPNLRLCVAPLRYGAGLKGKLATSMGYGVPSVVSPIAIEGMGLVHGQQVLVADTPDMWIEEIHELYFNQKLWNELSLNGLKFVQEEYSMERNTKHFRSLFAKLRAEPE